MEWRVLAAHLFIFVLQAVKRSAQQAQGGLVPCLPAAVVPGRGCTRMHVYKHLLSLATCLLGGPLQLGRLLACKQTHMAKEEGAPRS